MTLDELHIEGLFVLVLIGWACYFTLIAWEARRNRRADLAQRIGDRLADDPVQQHRSDQRTDDPDHDGREGSIVHARSVSR